MTEVTRISPQETQGEVTSGKALLVCAYADAARFGRFHLAARYRWPISRPKPRRCPKSRK